MRSICENREEAVSRFGEEVAMQLHARLSDILAADSIFDIIAGNPKKTGNPHFEHYRIDLDNGIKLELRANNIKKSYLGNGELNWLDITRVKIVKIQYCHE